MLAGDAVLYIKSRRKRLTPVRIEMLEIIYNSKKPVSAMEIIKTLSENNLNVNKTTVYRELAFFIKHDLVKEVQLDPRITYFESAHMAHHHHLVCNNCGRIDELVCEELEIPLKKLVNRVSTKFKIKKHNLEFYGTCVACS